MKSIHITLKGTYTVYRISSCKMWFGMCDNIDCDVSFGADDLNLYLDSCEDMLKLVEEYGVTISHDSKELLVQSKLLRKCWVPAVETKVQLNK